LSSQKDYVVEYNLIQDSDSKLGSLVNDLPVDDKIISVLSRKGIKQVYEFQEESIKRIQLGTDTVIIAPTASGKTEAFCIPILQRISERLHADIPCLDT
jgi:DEAD/DEAH box helicase domain-containing protein